jgi:hypothetical protein
MLDLLFAKSLIWIEPLYHLAAVEIEKPLGRDAERTEPQLLVVNFRPDQIAHDGSQPLGIWSDLLRRCRVSKVSSLAAIAFQMKD